MIKNLIISVLVLLIMGVSIFVGLRIHRSKEKMLRFDDLDRRYRLHAPVNLDPNRSYPLVIALHGLTDDPVIMEFYTGLSTKADQKGFFVVYPYGIKSDNFFSSRSWNGEFCCGYAYQNNINDVGFLNALIDELVNNYNIDRDKVYLVGYSNGGMLAYSAASQLANKISSAAVVGGAVGGKSEDDGEMKFINKSYQPIPMAIFRGRYDNVVPFDGGYSSSDMYEFSGAYDSLNFWLENNGCEKSYNETVIKNDYRKEIYNQCQNQSKVVFYAVNGGHVWPGGFFDPIKFFSKNGFKATNEIIEFFGL